MSRLRYHLHYLYILMASTILLTSISNLANAGLVSTPDIVDSQQLVSERDQLQILLARDDVQKALTEQGVDPIAARKRVDGMTASEVQTMVAKMDQLPAGGRFSTVELLLIIIIIILLI